MRRLLLGAGLLLASLVAWADVPPIPALTARVTDLTATLSGDQRQHLEQQLAALEAKNGAQLAVLLVPTTGDDSIEEYAVRTFEKWKLGQKKVDDGVLLLVAKNDRTLRIEVGYGLEGAITDVQAGRIISERITPQFRQGNFLWRNPGRRGQPGATDRCREEPGKRYRQRSRRRLAGGSRGHAAAGPAATGRRG